MPTDENLEEKANQPKSATIDGQTVNNHSLSEQIELDKYIEAKKVCRSKKSPVKFTKIISGGAV